jgi:hypothetical protein
MDARATWALLKTFTNRTGDRAITAWAMLILSVGITCRMAVAQMATQSTITSMAGNGTACSSSTSICGDGDAGATANLNNAQHVPVDSPGNLYIAGNSDKTAQMSTNSSIAEFVIAGSRSGH